MFANNRINRINEDIQREIAVLLRNIKDPRVRQGMLSVTAVDTTTDLRHAKVFVSVYDLGSEKELIKGLKSAAGYLRHEIGKALSLRHTPELHFEIDGSIERGARISAILNGLPETHEDAGESFPCILNPEETAEWLKSRDNFLILTHVRPDGDATGCAGALAQGLRELGKTAYILPNPEITPRYLRFVEQYHAPEGFTPDNTIAVDIASQGLLADNASQYIDRITLCIDHHTSNTKYAENLCINSDRASCGEIVYEILMALSGEVSPWAAECLYVAVSTDTGCFSYANTTADTLRTASLLIEAGAPHRVLNKGLFRTKTKARVKIEGMVLSGLQLYFDGAAAIAVITREMMAEAGANEDDVDDISSLPCAIEGVRAGITIREMASENDCKGSVRTMPGVDAGAVAAHFGGGGHAMAAGFTCKASVSEVKDKIIEVLSDYL